MKGRGGLGHPLSACELILDSEHREFVSSRLSLSLSFILSLSLSLSLSRSLSLSHPLGLPLPLSLSRVVSLVLIVDIGVSRLMHHQIVVIDPPIRSGISRAS